MLYVRLYIGKTKQDGRCPVCGQPLYPRFCPVMMQCAWCDAVIDIFEASGSDVEETWELKSGSQEILANGGFAGSENQTRERKKGGLYAYI